MNDSEKVLNRIGCLIKRHTEEYGKLPKNITIGFSVCHILNSVKPSSLHKFEATYDVDYDKFHVKEDFFAPHPGAYFIAMIGENEDEFSLGTIQDIVKPNREQVDPNQDTLSNKYAREIKPGLFVDVYDVLDAFKTGSSAIDHAIKKLLAPGKRGYKDELQDLKEAMQSIQRRIDRINEWKEHH